MPTFKVKNNNEWIDIATAGTPGKSAYQSAVEGGYTGTEAEFVTVLANAATTVTPATLPASGWVGDAAPYTQTVTVAGLVNGRRAMIYPAYGDDTEANIAMREACACISYAKRDGSNITITCLEDKPGVDITVAMEVYV